MTLKRSLFLVLILGGVAFFLTKKDAIKVSLTPSSSTSDLVAALPQATLPIRDGQFKSETFQTLLSLHSKWTQHPPETINQKTSLQKSTEAAKIYENAPARAIPLLIEAIDYAPTNEEAYSLLSKINLHLQKFEAAKKYALDCMAIRLDLNLIICQAPLVEAMKLSGKTEEATAYLKDCLIKDPQSTFCSSALVPSHQ